MRAVIIAVVIVILIILVLSGVGAYYYYSRGTTTITPSNPPSNPSSNPPNTSVEDPRFPVIEGIARPSKDAMEKEVTNAIRGSLSLGGAAKPLRQFYNAKIPVQYSEPDLKYYNTQIDYNLLTDKPFNAVPDTCRGDSKSINCFPMIEGNLPFGTVSGEQKMLGTRTVSHPQPKTVGFGAFGPIIEPGWTDDVKNNVLKKSGMSFSNCMDFARSGDNEWRFKYVNYDSGNRECWLSNNLQGTKTIHNRSGWDTAVVGGPSLRPDGKKWVPITRDFKWHEPSSPVQPVFNETVKHGFWDCASRMYENGYSAMQYNPSQKLCQIYQMVSSDPFNYPGQQEVRAPGWISLYNNLGYNLKLPVGDWSASLK